MQRDDLIEVGELLAEGLDAVAGMAQETHEAVAERAFLIPGSAGRPVQQIHDAIAAGVYRGVRAGLRGGARYGSRAFAHSVKSDAPALADQTGGAVALGAINGLVGDLLTDRGSHLATQMTLRSFAPSATERDDVGAGRVGEDHDSGDADDPDSLSFTDDAELRAVPGRRVASTAAWARSSSGHAIELTAEDLALAYPAATGQVAVFIHGLCETELAWRGLPFSRTGERNTPFPERLEADAGYTPVMLRFNSGVHISQSAADLDALLQRLAANWPVPITELVLIGHSMGGLIARGAAHAAGLREAGDHRGDEYAGQLGTAPGELRPAVWTGRLRHVVCLGSPHLGADLERGVHLLGWALGQAQESRAFAKLLWLRSEGIKDLRYGAALEADWRGLDPDALIRQRCADVPFLPHADYSWISAEITDGVAGRLFGDLLVRTPSASGVGKARRVAFDVDHGATLTGLTHFDLLDHPDVYEQLLGWLTRPRRLALAAA